ncbi:hypothetical protein DYB37_004552 [Aphanomyces astaci]|uniref:Acylphosphatase-like domain-containing protein n=1 Tax=Aphanomyces astaci TaxID=112090 RepID=A0A397BBZ3_APHAT|nr:hypothetical protein DYB25_006195 [Aphanomyces astaci]RHY45844.1 hypothetical protein DYB34_008038 [Aphanomyces astaci]RHY69190.1 hypothetical protein DYB30_008195 [Aphanomyces astaci]RHZ19591.1 hypothetical protein DYB37_004552 [Aphanomyces astaci]
MDVLALRLDHLKARGTYVATIKTWLQETQVNGRLVSRGDLHLFVAEGPTEAIDALLVQFETEPVDTNARGENDTMLEKLVLEEWGVPKDWLTTARSTPRTKRFLAWKEQAKVARKQGRRRTAQVRDETKQKQREAKRQKTESAADDKKEDKTT